MLEEKIAVVTGASRGIGRAIAKELALKGAFVIVNYNGSKQAADETVNEITQAGGKAVGVQCNVADAAECEAFINNIISEYGRIDILVNNAGIVRDNLLMRISEKDFDAVIDTNLKGTFHTMRLVARPMLRQRSGRIINVSSVVGISGNAGQTNYSASKAGIIGFTKSLAKEVGSRNILVNAVAPGFIETQMTDVLKEEVKEEISKTIPLKRMGTVEDVANVVKFLASKDSSYITGQVINIDGGMLM